MAALLFIFAALCIASLEIRDGTRKSIWIMYCTILKYQTVSQASKLDRTYLLVLNRLVLGQDGIEKEKLAREFREVIGAVVLHFTSKSPLRP
jgi:hypothetical protein